MTVAQAVTLAFGVIAWIAFVVFLWLYASGGFLIRQGKLLYVIAGHQADNADLPQGTRISYGKLGAIAVVIAETCMVLYALF